MLWMRLSLILFTTLLITSYRIGTSQNLSWLAISYTILGGLLLGALLLALHECIKKIPSGFLIAILGGLFMGTLMGGIIFLIFNQFIAFTTLSISETNLTLFKLTTFLSFLCAGFSLTLKFSKDFLSHNSFNRFLKSSSPLKEMILDASALLDERVIDFLSLKIFDHTIVIPRYLLKEFNKLSHSDHEVDLSKSKNATDIVKKLETISSLTLRYEEMDFVEMKDSTEKIYALARILQADILTAEMISPYSPSPSGIKVINLQSLYHILKPSMQRGECFNVKIQRPGKKEEGQGVGYLEDGTMVVVNGGGNFIGKMVKARLLSIKQTSSGRMIFCNIEESCAIS